MGKITLDRRPGRAAPPQLAALRGRTSEAVARYPRHPAVEITYEYHNGIRCLVLTPHNMVATLLYFHGGGFRVGSPEIAAGFASRLAAAASCRIVIPFYSLAPDDPFPAALLDGQAVLENLVDDNPLLIAGDSAGGNLAAVLARRFSSYIRGALLISPWLDLRVTAGSYEKNSEVDKIFSRGAASDAAELYLQGHSSQDPDVSPLLGDLSCMPPSLLVVGSTEVLLDDSVAFSDNMASEQRPVSLHVLPEMAHVEPTLMPDSENTAEVLKLASNFIAFHLDAA